MLHTSIQYICATHSQQIHMHTYTTKTWKGSSLSQHVHTSTVHVHKTSHAQYTQYTCVLHTCTQHMHTHVRITHMPRNSPTLAPHTQHTYALHTTCITHICTCTHVPLTPYICNTHRQNVHSHDTHKSTSYMCYTITTQYTCTCVPYKHMQNKHRLMKHVCTHMHDPCAHHTIGTT